MSSATRTRGMMSGIIAMSLIATCALAQPAVAVTPVHPDNRSAPLANRTNGELPSSDLINVAPNCRAHRAAASSLSLLLSSAKQRNIALSTAECYRSLADQIAISRQWSNAGNSACAAAPAPSGGVIKGTSVHGWGKAADFRFGTGSWNSPGYRHLKSVAHAYGWNHPGWAEPGGSACPEAWHWEWVGDGGTMGASPLRADVIAMLPSPGDNGYLSITGLGAVAAARGNAVDHGSASDIPLNWVMVSAASTADRNGYWMVGADGGIFSFGNATFHGSTGNIALNAPIVGMAPTPTGNGYWLVASDGGIFSFGDAQFHGSTGSMRLNRPIVGMAPTPTGDGYWLVASDGGIFSFGDAQFHGSMGAISLNQPVVGMAATPSGNGYHLIASDGGIFSFGDAQFRGSTGFDPPDQPVVGIARTMSGNGYWITAANGDIYAYGDARYFGAG